VIVPAGDGAVFQNFLAELKRRHVIRVAGIYTVAAWGAFQVANTVFQTLDLPKWTSTLALAIAALGLPVIVAVAWIFERRPGGEIAVTEDAPQGVAGPRLSRTDILILSGMVLVAGLVGAQVGGLIGSGKAPLPGLGAPETTQTDRPSTIESPSNRRSNNSGISERNANSRRRRFSASARRRCFSAGASEPSLLVSLSSFFCSLRCSSGLSGLPSRSSVWRYGCPPSISVSQDSRFVETTLPWESRCFSTECACQV